MKKIIVVLCVFCISLTCSASENASAVITPSASPLTYKKALEKFYNSNVISSYDDFQNILNAIDNNDFEYVAFARAMADLGFFDLATSAILEVKDTQIFGNYIEELRTFYFPNKKLTKENEQFLAETLSNIVYNNQSYEATKELLKKRELIQNSDYASYLMALGYYKSNYFTLALQYIDIAILQNPSNINYQILKAKVVAAGKNTQNALKIVSALKKYKLRSVEFENDIIVLEQYLLSKADLKNNDYYLANYYYLQKEYAKATKILLNSTLKEKEKIDNYALLAAIYFDTNEIEKAKDMLKKVQKKDKNKGLVVAGDLKFKNKEYKSAIRYYSKALKKDKNSTKTLVKLARAYQLSGNQKKAQATYSKILKLSATCYEAYFEIGLMNDDTDYIKKALSINIFYKPAWAELSKIEFNKANIELAQKYLKNTIDESEFRYYYRQRLGL